MSRGFYGLQIRCGCICFIEQYNRTHEYRFKYKDYRIRDIQILNLQTPINIKSRSSGIMHIGSLFADQATTIDHADIWDKLIRGESWYFVII